MRVLYDYQTFHLQRFGGISRYFRELAGRMAEVEPRIALCCSMNQYLRHSGLVRYWPVARRPYKMLMAQFRSLNRWSSIRALKQGQFDVFHPTYYDPYFLPHLGGKPFVLTIHDMTHERYPEYFSPRDTTPQDKRLLAQQADHIIAISECTRRDIIEFLGVDEAKITVIPHGLEPQAPSDERVAGVPERYVLYVGERRAYKNFDRTMEAFARIAADDSSLHLVLTGRPLSPSERSRMAELGILGRVIVKSDVADAQLARLYRDASVFVYPSLYEGFGIPILEAFAQDCPVVLSRASCFPEVAGDAAEYFDPYSTESMVEALHTVLTDTERRTALITKGRERLTHYTWTQTARLTEQLYLSLHK